MWNIPISWNVDLNLLKPGRWHKIHLWASFGPWATSWWPPVSQNFPSLHKPRGNGEEFLTSSTGLGPAIVLWVSHCSSFHFWIHNPRSPIFYNLTLPPPKKKVIPTPSLYQLQCFFLHQLVVLIWLLLREGCQASEAEEILFAPISSSLVLKKNFLPTV